MLSWVISLERTSSCAGMYAEGLIISMLEEAGVGVSDQEQLAQSL